VSCSWRLSERGAETSHVRNARLSGALSPNLEEKVAKVLAGSATRRRDVCAVRECSARQRVLQNDADSLMREIFSRIRSPGSRCSCDRPILR